MGTRKSLIAQAKGVSGQAITSQTGRLIMSVAMVMAMIGLLPLQTPVADAESKLTAPDAAAGDEFGNSVAIDGDTAVAGAVDRACAAGSNCGAAYVFVRSGTTWTLQQELTAADAAGGDAFGGSVAVSGSTIVIGAPGKTCLAGAKCGAAYVFVWSGATWSQQQELTAADAGAGDGFGIAVAVNGDTVVGGASPKACAAGSGCGAAYVFVRNGAAWTEQQELTASVPAAFEQFGHSVAVSHDTAVIGAQQRACAAGTACGAAYVFVRSATTWTQQQILTANDAAAFDLLGTAVGLSGETAVAGAPLKPCAAGAGCGAAYVFVRSGVTWSQQQVLKASDAALGDNLGVAVAVSGDTTVAGTALKACTAGVRCGAGYLFARVGTTWSQQQKLTPSDAAANDFFGAAVAMSAGTTLVGALDKACSAGVGCGAAYAYTAATTQTPIAKCKDVVVDNDRGSCDATVTVAQVNDGSSDPDGDAITLSLSPAGPYPVGTTEVTLTVSDSGGVSASCQASITVIDNEPPAISNLSATPSVLWPPNHRLVDVAVNFGVTDNCGVAVCALVVTSNEPVDGTSIDWQIVDAAHVRLRAERAGTGSGRVYTIAPVCTDGSGNSSSQGVNVTVPKSAARLTQPARLLGNKRLRF